MPRTSPAFVLVSFGIAAIVASLHAQQAPSVPRTGEVFRFRSGVELINVTATVSDASGRFVSGLRQEDFIVYDDDQRVEVTHFSAERVPVSVGIALDTSGSMSGDKMSEARSALDRFLYDLLDAPDEVFLYRFSNYPVLVEGWTTERKPIAQALDRITPSGGTALYDTVAEAIPLAQTGGHRKKALIVISDGNDTSSRQSTRDLRRQIRESDVLVYAVGIDGDSEATVRRVPPPPRFPIPAPFPFPPGSGRGVPRGWPPIGGGTGGGNGGYSRRADDDRVNAAALREITDESGGRTEIIRDARDLNPATASIADELSKQYYLGYSPATAKDGRWHTIRVELRNRSYRVRARRGYMAS